MENTTIITLPVEVSELANKVSANKKNEVQTVLQQIFTGTDDWEKQVEAIDVKDVNDSMSIQLADAARKNAKTARLNAEKIFDAKREEVQQLKSEYDLEDKLWLKAKQVMQLKFKAIEEKAEWKANFVKRFEAEQKELRTQKRINEVAKFAELNRIEFEFMSEESFESFLSGLEKTHEDKIQAEKEAKEKTQADAIKLKLHNERREIAIPYYEFWSEFEKTLNFGEQSENDFNSFMVRNKKAKSEKDAEIEAQRLENERLKADAEKMEAELEIERKKQAAKLKKEQEEKAALEAELKAKKDTEAKAEQQRLDSEAAAKKEAEKLAKAPMKNQLIVWVDSFSLPSTNVDNELSKSIIAKFEAYKNWAKSEIEKL